MQSYSVFDVSPVAMSLYLFGDEKVYDVNQAWLDLFGYKDKSEVLGKDSEENSLKYSNFLQGITPGLIEENVYPEKAETKIITKDGRELTLLLTVKISFIGNSKYLLLIIEDITDLKRTEKALRESESKYRRIVETANEGIWQLDAGMKTVYVNNKMAGMLGYTPEEMIGRHVFDFMEEECRASVIKKSAKYSTRKIYGRKYLKKDGSVLHALISTALLYDSQGKYEGSIGMLTDISVRIDVEKALRKTRRKLDIALENGRIGIWEWNINTGEMIWDGRTSEMLGLKEESCKGSFLSFENVIHEEDISHVREAVQRSIRFNRPLTTIFRTMPENGQSKYISLKAFVSKDRRGNPSIMTGVCFDVTEMKKDAEQGLIKLNEELLRSNNDLKQFAYIASHDLQEPLRMVSSFTQLLQQKYYDKLDDDGKEYIKYAVDGSKRMFELLNGLLAYSRIHTRGKEFVKVDMNEVLEKVKSNLSLIINETGCVIESTKLPVILADENQMIQLLQNLVENGIKFSVDSPVIRITSSRNDDHYLFSVKDEGVGIEQQYFEKIFRIFQRLYGPGEYKGTGIGLAICKRIVERHGGTIWLKSVPGKGSTFFFTIAQRPAGP